MYVGILQKNVMNVRSVATVQSEELLWDEILLLVFNYHLACNSPSAGPPQPVVLLWHRHLMVQ